MKTPRDWEPNKVAALLVFIAASLAYPRVAHAQPTSQAWDATPPSVSPGELAPPHASDAPKPVAHEVERSELVPDVYVRQMKSRAADPKIEFRPGKGLTVSSADGAFEINLRIRGQILGTFEKEHSGENQTLIGAQIRRARLPMQGHWFGKHNKYKFELAASPRDSQMGDGNVTTAPLLDWYLTFDYLKAATVVVGQYKVPFSRQRVITSGALQMVDRSIVQSEFNLDRNVGIDIRSTSLLDGHFHYFAGVYGGEGRNAFELRDNNIVYLGRIEFLPFGRFNDYVEADFERTGPRVSIGGSYAHVPNSARNAVALGRSPRDGGTTTFDTAEADILLKLYGLSAMGEFFWREGDRTLGNEVDQNGVPIRLEHARDGWGWFTQLGFLIPQTMFEVEGRYGMMRRSNPAKSSLANRSELGGGLSYYFAQHSFKLQADYFRLWQNDRIGGGADQIRVQLEAGF